MLGFFGEMFEVMTFYKPIKALIAEKPSVLLSVFRLATVFAAYFIVFSLATVAAAYFSGGAAANDQIYTALSRQFYIFVGLFAFIFVYVLAGSAAAYAFSRLFSSSGTLSSLVAVNFFLIASAAMFALLFFIPYSQFAGMILLFLGSVLYMYFLDESLSELFSASAGKSLFLLLLYLVVPPLLGVGILWAMDIIGVRLPFSLTLSSPF